MKNKSNENNSVNLDYSRIKDEVSQNIREQMPQKPRKKLPTWKRVMLVATYTLLVCAVTLGCTLGVQQAYAASSQATFRYIRDPRKNNFNIIPEYFDDFVAFGGGDPNCVSSEEILGCKFISEADKIVFEEYCTKSATNKFNIYLGQKDGKDTVLIYAVGGYYTDKALNGEEDIGILVFDSNLEYSFASIVKAFEKLSGTTLTQEFLRSRFSEDNRKYPESYVFGESTTIPTFYDHAYLDNIGGIIIRFRALQSCSDFYTEYSFITPPLQREFGEIYFTKINGQIYGVTREMLMFEYEN